MACNEEWASDFLFEMKKRNVPIDFFSWHIYATEPARITEKAERIKKLLAASGYGDAESILNEWNYVKGWTDEFKHSIEAIHGMKGAAFVMAAISAGQKCPGIDMMMYYDTRPSAFCGAFDFYTFEPLKGYYPLMWYGKLYDAEGEISCEEEPENIYTLCGVDKNGKALCIITSYSDENPTEKEIKVDFGRKGTYEIYLLDDKHDGELVKTTEALTFTMDGNSCMLIKEI